MYLCIITSFFFVFFSSINNSFTPDIRECSQAMPSDDDDNYYKNFNGNIGTNVCVPLSWSVFVSVKLFKNTLHRT